MTHTKEPWAYRPYEHDDWGVVRSAATDEQRGGIIFQANDPTVSFDDLHAFRIRGDDPYEANARRIVDCVNAMQGIPDPAAYVAAMGEVVEALEHLTTFTDDTCRYVDADPLIASAQAALATARAQMGERT